MILIRLAWRNIWRNKLRSTVVILAFTLGIFAGIFTIAFTNGMVTQRMGAITDLELSHIQIHQQNFRENYDFSLRISNSDEILENVSNIPAIEGASKRIVISSMVASAENNTGARIIGVVPEQEQKITKLHEKITEGTYFECKKRNPVIISQRLADKLKVGMNKKIVITMQDTSGNIVSGAFRICGIFATDNAIFDASVVIARFDDLSALTSLPSDQSHEIVIRTTDKNFTEASCNSIREAFPELETLDWLELSPEASSIISMMDQYLVAFMLIILMALCFGIVNTMLMAVLERARETGMLMAIGMSKKRVFFMIVIETLFLSVTGGFVGIILGYVVTYFTGISGINLSMWSEAYSAIGYSAFIFPEISMSEIIQTAIMLGFTGFLAALYPAYKAVKPQPAKALRME